MAKKGYRPGWVLVPREPTQAMLHAARRALKRHIETLPPEERDAIPNHKMGGKKVATDLKHKIRYQAMLSAAPPYDFEL